MSNDGRDEHDTTGDVSLRTALHDWRAREAVVSKYTPLSIFLRRVGAYFRPAYDEVDYTDWNGAVVGRGAGSISRDAIPPDPALPFSELEPLLALGDFARELVARHPSTPTRVLVELAGDPREDVQRGVAERVGKDGAIQRRLVDSRFRGMRYRMAGDPELEHELLLELTRDADPSIRSRAFENPQMSAELLATLARDATLAIAFEIARHPQAGPETLRTIAERNNVLPLGRAFAANPATPPEVLERLLPHGELHVPLAAHRGSPPVVARTLARSAVVEVRRAVATNPSADSAALALMVEDPDQIVRMSLAANPRFSAFADLATDPNSAVRHAVARRADAPREVLEALRQDSQSVVREAAAHALASRHGSGH